MELDNIILNICNYEYEYFLRKANVQGVGLGYKVVNGCTTLEKAIQVYVAKKINKNCLTNDNLIPTCYQGIKTDVIETGFFTVKDNSMEINNGLTGRVRPVTCGYSIGPAKFKNTATYGALVTDGERYYMLGSNHLLANSNSFPLGYPILQPGVEDGGRIELDMIVRLSKFVPLRAQTFFYTPTNYVDCAIAEVLTSGTVSPDITFIGKPTGITNPTLGLEVQAACRTSTYIKAKVSAIGVTVIVKDNTLGNLLFKNQIELDFPIQSGDSGALFVTSDKKAIGLSMSSSDDTTTCNPIKTVLDSLDVMLV